MRGPLFNKTVTITTGRDNLGIDSVFSSITSDLCPVVNTVTPAPFYWIFLTWLYYDAHVNAKIKLTETKLYRQYIRRQEYFFILANVLANGNDNINTLLNGKDNVSNHVIGDDGPYDFYEEYYGNSGGMNYYSGGLVTLGIVHDDGNQGRYPTMSTIGKQLALSVENKIKDTKYYKFYRLNGNPVPKDVLIEYAQSINAALKGFDESKTILKQVMFDETDNRKYLCYTRDYLLYIHNNIMKLNKITYKDMRKILYEVFSYKNKEKYKLSPELKWISTGWEIAIGRVYFTMGVEIIWKQLLDILNANPMDLEDWLNKTISSTADKDTLNMSVIEVLSDSEFNFEENESQIDKITKTHQLVNDDIIFAIKLMLSVYKRFYNRDDLDDTMFMDFFKRDYDNLALSDWFKLVEEYEDKPLKELLCYVMKHYCIKQHLNTAKRKMYYGRDGYYIEKISDVYYYIRKHYVFFKGNRIMQFISVMKCLDMLGE